MSKSILPLVTAFLLCASNLFSEDRLVIQTPMSPPHWALLQRQLLRANAEACGEFYGRYFDERGFLRCVERWGGDDGPDDAPENCADWPTLHALGADDSVRRLYRKAWEGHLRQFTLAKTTQVPFAKDGMYYKEFPVMFDWQHNGEGLRLFYLLGLSEPSNGNLVKRSRRFAGFYMGEDPGAKNYDARHKIIRSMINGSRGPLLRKATALDWTGDPIEVANRFDLGHGERSYEEMLAHFKDYNDVVGDHPLNLLTTNLAMNAYMLTGQQKYRRWVLDYVGAWRDRTVRNGNVIPSNIGLDGKIGGECDGKWYGGTYGWGFSPIVPQTGKLAHRNRTHTAFYGFRNAFLLTGDDAWLDVWRKMISTINAQKKVIKGRAMYPTMYGDKGWYAYAPAPYSAHVLDIYYHSMKEADKRVVADNAWVRFLDGKNSGYPRQVLQRDLGQVRQRVIGMRQDKTTPDTRLADDPMKYNPCNVNSLIELMLGGITTGRWGGHLQCRLRYFDPVRRRAGVPQDVAVLVDKLTADETSVTFVNISQSQRRELIVQAGGYGEHEFVSVSQQGETRALQGRTLNLRLAPGCGQKLTFKMKRYANVGTLRFPWNRVK